LNALKGRVDLLRKLASLRRILALWINPKRRYQNKNESNGERNKGKSFIVRAALHDCAPDSFAILERRAPSRLFSDNCEIAPTNKLSFSVR
jgi:hypothetical protein